MLFSVLKNSEKVEKQQDRLLLWTHVWREYMEPLRFLYKGTEMVRDTFKKETDQKTIDFCLPLLRSKETRIFLIVFC